MRYRLVCLDAGFTVLSPVRSLSEALRGVLAEHGHARSAGMHAVLLRRPEWNDRSEPTAADVRVIASLAELPALVLGGQGA